MAINTQKFLPAAKGGISTKINKTKVNSSTPIFLSEKSQSNIGLIRVKVIEIDSILKGTLASQKKILDDRKRKESAKRREDIETKLETKPKVETGKVKTPETPRMGFLDWIKNFIGNILLGYFAVRLVDHLPKIIPIVKLLGRATDFVLNVGGKLLDGLVTFIDWGYKAYDATRGFARNLFGEDGVKQFDQLSGLLNNFLNLALIAGMAAAGSGGLGKVKVVVEKVEEDLELLLLVEVVALLVQAVEDLEGVENQMLLIRDFSMKEPVVGREVLLEEMGHTELMKQQEDMHKDLEEMLLLIDLVKKELGL